MTGPGVAAFSLKTAWRAGPDLIRRAPRAFLAWALLRMIGQYVAMAAALAMRDAHFGLLASNIWGAVIDLPFQAVLMTAVVRGCLDLGDSRRAFLGFGLAEARMFGLILLTALAALLIATPAAIAATYFGYFMRLQWLAAASLAIGAAVAAVVLMRLAPLPVVLIAEGRFDLRAALSASRGRYAPLAASVLLVAGLERLVQDGMRALLHPPLLLGWTALLSSPRIVAVLWDSLTDILALTLMAGMATAAWRSRR